jgi:hypothetical protein
MPMQVESLEVLEKAELPPGQARAIVRAIEIEIAGAKDTLATKQDVVALKQDMLSIRQELRGEISGLGTSLRAEMADLGASLRVEMADLGASLRVEIARQGGELEAKIAASASSTTRQMYLAILGQTAVMLGFAYFFATYLR